MTVDLNNWVWFLKVSQTGYSVFKLREQNPTWSFNIPSSSVTTLNGHCTLTGARDSWRLSCTLLLLNSWLLVGKQTVVSYWCGWRNGQSFIIAWRWRFSSGLVSSFHISIYAIDCVIWKQDEKNAFIFILEKENILQRSTTTWCMNSIVRLKLLYYIHCLVRLAFKMPSEAAAVTKL